MPATNQLSKIVDLVDRVSKLDGKQRGMRIEADDWNALVGVLQGMLEVDRAQEDGPVPHSKSALRFAITNTWDK